MESLIKICEGCEKLWQTFKFYYGRTDGKTERWKDGKTDGHRPLILSPPSSSRWGTIRRERNKNKAIKTSSDINLFRVWLKRQEGEIARQKTSYLQITTPNSMQHVTPFNYFRENDKD
jgi:hypothetical protein